MTAHSMSFPVSSVLSPTTLAEMDLQVCKKYLTEAEYVAEARRLARDLVQNEVRGPGDTDGAMRRIEARYGVPYTFLWSLRYRPPRDILMGAWSRLLAAYEAECERVENRARLERERIQAIRDATDRSVANADSGVASEEVA